MPQEPIESFQGTLLYAALQSHSPKSIPTAVLVQDSDSLQFMFQHLQLSGPTSKDLLAKIDFSQTYVLVITMGQKNTEGYKLGLEANSNIDVYSTHITVTTVWTEPPPGSQNAALKNNPCVMIGLPAGKYSKVRIYDQSKRLRFVTQV